MAHPLDGLVDSILGRAASEGRFAGLPKSRDLVARFRTSEHPPKPLDEDTFGRNSVVVLCDAISRATYDLNLLHGTEAGHARSEDILDLKLRLAAELQVMRRPGRGASDARRTDTRHAPRSGPRA